MATMWECECGNTEYGENPPLRCRECSLVGSFLKLSDEEAEEREAENILSAKGGEDED